MPEPDLLDHDSFELKLSQRLHGHPLPPGIPGLDDRSRRRGQQLQRRRRVAVAAAVTAVIGGTAFLGERLPVSIGVRPAPAATAPAPPTTSPSLVDVGALPMGPAPRVDFVHQSVWHRSDGTRRVLTDADRSQGALSWVHLGDRLFVSKAQGPDFGYSIDGRAYRAAPRDAEAGYAVPGPDGSVLLEGSDLHILTREGRWRRNADYGADRGKLTGPRAARNTVWSVDERGVDPVVVRSASLEPGAATQTFGQWHSVTTADQPSDQVVLSEKVKPSDDAGCDDIVDGTSGDSRWHSCEWTFLRLSSDGRYVLARARSGLLAVLDIARESVVYRLGLSADVTEETFRFAADGTLTAVVRDPDEPTAEAIVSCDVSGSCWRSTEWSIDFRYVLVTGER